MLSSPLHSSPPPQEEMMFRLTNRLCVIVFELRRTPLSTRPSESLHFHGVSSKKIINPNLDLILRITVQNLCLKFLRKDNSLAVLVTLLKQPHAISDYHGLTQVRKTHSPIHLASLYRNGLQFPAAINETSTVKTVCVEMTAAAPSIEETTRLFHWFQVKSVAQLPTEKHTSPNIQTVSQPPAVDAATAGGKNNRVCLGQSLIRNYLGYGPMGHSYYFSESNHLISPLNLEVLNMGFKFKIGQLRLVEKTDSVDLNSKHKELRLSLIFVNGSKLSSRLFLPDISLLRSKTVIYFRSPTLSTEFVNNVGPQSDNLVFSRALVLGSKVKFLQMALHYAELVSSLDVFILYFIAMLIVLISLHVIAV